MIDRPTTEVPLSSSNSRSLQNIGVSNIVGRESDRVSSYGALSIQETNQPRYFDHFELEPWAVSHIMHSMSPTHPMCIFASLQRSSPTRPGRVEVSVERRRPRGILKRTWPSCGRVSSWVMPIASHSRNFRLTGISLTATAPRPQPGNTVNPMEDWSKYPPLV
jgi:hypothetical protein